MGYLAMLAANLRRSAAPGGRYVSRITSAESFPQKLLGQ